MQVSTTIIVQGYCCLDTILHCCQPGGDYTSVTATAIVYLIVYRSKTFDAIFSAPSFNISTMWTAFNYSLLFLRVFT